VISAATRKLAGELFEWEDLGEQWLNGFARPQHAWRPLRMRDVESRFETFRHANLTALTGRDDVVTQLLQAWQQAKIGHGNVVLLVGDAGIGKSRVIQELRTAIRGDVHVDYICQCWAHHQDSAFLPVIELLERILDCGREKPLPERLASMQAALGRAGLDSPEWVPILAPLLGLQADVDSRALGLVPELRKQRTIQALVAALSTVAATRPVLFVVEDAHWIDPSTAELLAVLVAGIAGERILVVVSGRPEFVAEWPKQRSMQLELGPLDAQEVRAMARAMVGGRALPPDVLAQITQRADGIPLFVEELVRLIVDSGMLVDHGDRFDAKPGWDQAGAIPSSLQDLLLARLGHLTWEQSIGHLAAVLGRRFEYRLIRAIWRDSESLLKEGLERLVRVGLVSKSGRDDNPAYVFRHVLVQDAAYNSMLKASRIQIHARVAEELERHFPEVVQNQPELVAHHFNLACDHRRAIAYLLLAGKRSSERSEHLEAVRHLHKALELLALLPENRERAARELEALVVLSNPLVRTKGYGSPELETVLKRAREICRALGDPPQLLSVLICLALFHTARSDLALARELGEQVLNVSATIGDPTLELMACRTLGSAIFWQGELALARTHLQRAATIYDRDTHHGLAHNYFVDPGVVCLSTLSLNHWMLGDPNQALETARACVELGRSVSHPFSLGFALVYSASAHQLCGAHQAALKLADEAIALSDGRAFPQGIGWGAVLRGWVWGRYGRAEEGIAEIERGIAHWRSSGTALVLPYFFALLADLHRIRGDGERGLRVVADAMAMMQRTGECCFSAELLRLRGELRLLPFRSQPDAPNSPRLITDAEADFRDGMALARSQRARALEIRVGTSLARLLDASARGPEASALVEELRMGSQRAPSASFLDDPDLLAFICAGIEQNVGRRHPVLLREHRRHRE
jgi:tetratricopeptide (TPR) repeat protein